jgi:hypothetical protein
MRAVLRDPVSPDRDLSTTPDLAFAGEDRIARAVSQGPRPRSAVEQHFGKDGRHGAACEFQLDGQFAGSEGCQAKDTLLVVDGFRRPLAGETASCKPSRSHCSRLDLLPAISHPVAHAIAGRERIPIVV